MVIFSRLDFKVLRSKFNGKRDFLIQNSLFYTNMSLFQKMACHSQKKKTTHQGSLDKSFHFFGGVVFINFQKSSYRRPPELKIGDIFSQLISPRSLDRSTALNICIFYSKNHFFMQICHFFKK